MQKNRLTNLSYVLMLGSVLWLIFFVPCARAYQYDYQGDGSPVGPNCYPGQVIKSQANSLQLYEQSFPSGSAWESALIGAMNEYNNDIPGSGWRFNYGKYNDTYFQPYNGRSEVIFQNDGDNGFWGYAIWAYIWNSEGRTKCEKVCPAPCPPPWSGCCGPEVDVCVPYQCGYIVNPEVDVNFNTNYISNSAQLKTVAIHEFGHVAGLRHEPRLVATMGAGNWAYFGLNHDLSQLHADDKAGMRTLYSNGGSGMDVAVHGFRQTNTSGEYGAIDKVAMGQCPSSDKNTCTNISNSASPFVKRGEYLYLEYSAENHGTSSVALNDVPYGFYIFQNGTWRLLGYTYNVRDSNGNLIVMGTTPFTYMWYMWATVRIPSDIKPGAYRFKVVADCFNRLSETNETNNEFESWRTVQIQNNPPSLATIPNQSVNEGQTLTLTVWGSDPDGDPLTYTASGLICSWFRCTPTTLPNGAVFSGQTFSWTPAYNQAGSYKVRFSVSDGYSSASQDITIAVANVNRPPVLEAIANQTVTAGQPLTFTVSGSDPDGDALTYSASGLPQGATFSVQTFSWTPAANQIGTYSVTFTVSDGSLLDSKTVSISVMGVDFTPTAMTVPSSAATGTNIAVSYTVQNLGVVTSPGFYVQIFLSTDTTITTSDTWLVSRNLNGLTAGQSLTENVTAALPTTLAPGTYYVGVIVDPYNWTAEGNETNNIRVAGNTTVVSAGTDFRPTALTAPSSGVTGGNIALSYTVKNQGTGTSPGFYVQIFLSTDTTITTSDTWLVSRNLNGLTAGQSLTENVTAALPTTLTPGTYYVGVIVDPYNWAFETSETNNIRVAGNTTVVSAGTDFTPTALTAPSSTTRGASIAVSYTVKNQGTGTSPGFYVQIFLSTDTTITTSDTWLVSRNVSSLTAGQSVTDNLAVTVPITLTPGTYYIGVIVDPYKWTAEANETNNTRVAGNATTVN